MIKFNKLSQEPPFILLNDKYNEALSNNQKNIEAISISSYKKETNEVDARYVNLKIISGKEFIFFSNYNSEKSKQFLSNNNIAVLIFWNTINTQIRMKAKISKLDELASDNYFSKRQKSKNALAISSNQSEPISSFDIVKQNYLLALKKEDLRKRPEYWGGYKFVPYEFEFWTGHEFRLNHRTHFKLVNEEWQLTLLQP
jgi:pyridoxamine 5'-phosphate oxidase